LYEFPLEQIGVLIQPGSIIHSMVRFKDNQLKAQLGAPDMRLPIQYAILTALETLGIEFPGAKRPSTPLAPLSLVGNLELRAVNHARFPCLGLAYEAGRKGGVAPVALNAADEIAVEAFLAHKLPYLGIPKLIEAVLQEAPSVELSWESIAQTDAWARTRAKELVG
jgi:1-deoxy-D-xylulose-5-phosphate reductoisomerase